MRAPWRSAPGSTTSGWSGKPRKGSRASPTSSEAPVRQTLPGGTPTWTMTGEEPARFMPDGSSLPTTVRFEESSVADQERLADLLDRPQRGST
ncbi:hypothetical protein [Streptomyces europaeiscabiei]|uniref:hypothetical protein n=1 Tax=Streptomyces europaeiscabiei TaxID=146819 RepID=UPI0038D50FAB